MSYDGPKVFVNAKEYDRSLRGLDLILKWEPDYRPPSGWTYVNIYEKLDRMGLLKTFLEYEKDGNQR